MSTATETSVGPAPSTNGYLDSLDFLRASLSDVQANIFLADTTFNIIYANERALETLRGIEDEIRKAFDVEVDDIVGATIHRFHKDKRRVERILRNPAALPHQAEFSFGNITLQAKINGVFSPQKRRPRLHRQLGGRQPAPTHRERAVAAGVDAGERAHERAPGRPRPEDHLRQPGIAGHPAQAGAIPARQARERARLDRSTSSTKTRPTSARSCPTTRTCRYGPISRSAPRPPTCSSPPFTTRTRITLAPWSPGS